MTSLLDVVDIRRYAGIQRRRDKPIILDFHEIERLLDVYDAARMVSQWHDAIGSGPIAVLNEELGELWRLTHDE